MWCNMRQLTNVSNEESVMNNDSDHCSRPAGNLIVQPIQVWTLVVGIIRADTLQFHGIIVNLCMYTIFFNL